MTALDFNAIDVETANADRASICQIGIVRVRNGRFLDAWESLINPQDWFDPWNEDIHGITKNDVRNAPTLPQVRDELRRLLRGSVLVSHTSFDRVALERAMDKYDLERLQVQWLDSARIVRRAWPERYAQNGYALASVAHDLGIEFQAHDALEDARAAAAIVVNACMDTGLNIAGWLDRVRQPIDSSQRQPRSSARREPNADGPLSGEVIVFTGSLGLIRRVAADRAAEAGCKVMTTVNKMTTLLVIGTQEKDRLGGYSKSTKHRRAEELIAQGIDIQILSEDDFVELLK